MTILERLLRHDAWTTRALLERAAHLADAELDCEFDIGHKSLRRTFAHIIGNMECWCDLMACVPQRESPKGNPPNSISELTNRLDVVADQLLEIGRRIDREKCEDEFFVDYLDQPPRKKPLGAGLVHVATHGMHHRAQCLHIMRRLGMTDLIEGDAIGWELKFRGLSDWPLA